MKEVIAQLGRELGAPPTAIKKWRQRGSVPHRHRLPLLAIAERKGVPVSERDFKFEPSSPKERERQRQRAA